MNTVLTPLRLEIERARIRNLAKDRPHALATLDREYLEALKKLREKIGASASIEARQAEGKPAGPHWADWVGPVFRAKWRAQYAAHYAGEGASVRPHQRITPFPDAPEPGLSPSALDTHPAPGPALKTAPGVTRVTHEQKLEQRLAAADALAARRLEHKLAAFRALAAQKLEASAALRAQRQVVRKWTLTERKKFTDRLDMFAAEAKLASTQEDAARSHWLRLYVEHGNEFAKDMSGPPTWTDRFPGLREELDAAQAATDAAAADASRKPLHLPAPPPMSELVAKLRDVAPDIAEKYTCP